MLFWKSVKGGLKISSAKWPRERRGCPEELERWGEIGKGSYRFLRPFLRVPILFQAFFKGSYPFLRPFFKGS